MFRKIISNGAMTIVNSQSQRWSELSKFTTLRASLNNNSQKALQELASKNQIKLEELKELSKIVSLDLETLKQNINSELYPHEKEATLRFYRESSIGTRGYLQEVHSAVNAKYPQLGVSLGETAGYKEAYQGLNEIFVNSSIAVHNLRAGAYGEKFATDFKTKAELYVKNLLKEHEKNPEAIKTIHEINATLNNIINNYSQNPASTYARILTLLATRGITTLPADAATKAPANPATTAVPTLTIKELTAPVVEVVNSAKHFDAELSFIQEANLAIQKSVGNLPWEGDKMRIFQSSASQYSELPYYLLAILSGLGLAYFLYSGDAKYKTMLLTPVVGIAAFMLFKRNQVFNRIPTLTELFLHKDGKHVDAVISINGQTVTKSDILISSIKLNRGDHNVSLDLNVIDKANLRSFITNVSGQENNLNINFSQIRKYAARDGQILNLGDAEVLVPFNNIGNRIILKQIFKGVEVLPSSA